MRVALLFFVVPLTLAAQDPVPVALKPATGSVSGGFRNVSSMHEFSDGRVLLSDVMLGLMEVGDFASGHVQPANIGPASILPLAADTSILYDMQGQWVFVVGSNAIGMLPKENLVVRLTGGPIGADRFGHLLAYRETRDYMRGDSARLIIVDRASAAVDTVARLWNPVHTPGPSPPYEFYEWGALASDGWIGVLRVAPYRVDWRTPSGAWILGKALSIDSSSVDSRERNARMLMRAHGEPALDPETIGPWPSTIPPVVNTFMTTVSSDGMLVICRTATADHPDTRYDVINRRGERERQITMPGNQKILGFGAKSVYITVTALNGAQTVERHPWP